MITASQIPDEAVEAARAEYMSGTGSLTEDLRCAIAAALNAWTGGTHRRHNNQEWLDLPLPQEPPHD